MKPESQCREQDNRNQREFPHLCVRERVRQQRLTRQNKQQALYSQSRKKNQTGRFQRMSSCIIKTSEYEQAKQQPEPQQSKQATRNKFTDDSRRHNLHIEWRIAIRQV